MKRFAPALVCVLFLAGNLLYAGEVPPTYFGLSSYIHRPNSTEAWPSVPFNVIRSWDTYSEWNNLETSRGVYNWTNLDWLVNKAAANGAELLYTFGATPQWASSNPTATCYKAAGACAPPSNIQDWDDFVRAVATRYAGRIQHYEVWNEADLSGYWTGTPAQMVTMEQHAVQIIKYIDPTAQVTTPSVTAGADRIKNWLTQYFAAGGGKTADIIAFHGYPLNTSVANSNPAPEYITSIVAAVKSVAATYGLSAKPIWDTEASWGSGTISSEDTQAAYLVRQYLLHWSLGVERFYWYSWDSTSWGTLWDATNGVHKPGLAYKQVHDWMVGATLVSPCSADSNSTWTCEFTRPNGYQALAIWNPNGSRTITIGSQYRTQRSMYGTIYSVPTSGSVTIGTWPNLFENGTASNAPTAILTVTPKTGAIPLTVTADSSSSYDSDGSIASRTINFGDGTTTTATTASHVYSSAGTYTVTLTVTDNTGLQGIATQTVTANAPAPTCTASSVVPSVTICSPTTAPVHSPVHVVALTTDNVAVSFLQVYLNGNKVYQVNGGKMDTYLAMPLGTDRVTVQAKDVWGRIFKTTVYTPVN